MSETGAVVHPRAGECIDGRYVLERLVAADGACVVYRARDSRSERPVAFKLLPRDPRGQLATREPFDRTVGVLCALGHPNIATVVDHKLCAQRCYVVTDWFDGESLASRLARGPLTLEATLAIVRQLLAALASAHAAGLVHRNVKPSNVFLQRRKHGPERVKLLDFGFATLAAATTGTDASAATRRNAAPGYKAPELAAGEAADARADVYAVGALLCEMLTGAPPAPLPQAERAAPAEPALRRTSVEAALQVLAMRALSPRPQDRFADAAEMLCELVDALPAQPVATEVEPPPPEPERVAVADASLEPMGTLAVPAASTFEPPSDLSVPTAPTPETASALPAGGLRPRLRTLGFGLGGAAALALLLALVRGEPGRVRWAALQEQLASLRERWVGAPVPRLSPAPPAPPSPQAELYAAVAAEAPAGSAAATARAQHGSTAARAETRAAAGGAPMANTQARAAVPPSAAGRLGAATAAASKPPRPPAHNPWLDPVPPGLQGLPAFVATGADAKPSMLRALREYGRDHPSDPRSHLLLARIYYKRLWRADAVREFARAIESDPHARGAPEVLPALVALVIQGKAAEPAADLITRAYGEQALPAIDDTLAPMRNTEGAARLRSLRQRIAGEAAR